MYGGETLLEGRGNANQLDLMEYGGGDQAGYRYRHTEKSLAWTNGLTVDGDCSGSSRRNPLSQPRAHQMWEVGQLIDFPLHT